MYLIGCDFSSSPSRTKPIVVAVSQPWASTPPQGTGVRLQLAALERFTTLQAFGNWLAQHEDWLGGFDLPFGLPRELVEHLGWPTDWHACMAHYTQLSRADIRATFKAFCDARPVGGKFAHRATDGPAGSSPSMKWVNPPVAYMLHAGVPLLIAAGAHFAHLGHACQPAGQSAGRVALEAYPGLLAWELIGTRSYKSDDKARQTPERLIARKDILTRLESGQSRLCQGTGIALRLSHAQREVLIDDATGDSLDAVLCMLQAAWAQVQHARGHAAYGLPACDPLEGWIVTA
jgi:hypothetical protein